MTSVGLVIEGVTLVAGVEQSLDEAAKIATFRIIQEALNNVIRHADAHHVNISLRYAKDGVRAAVRDDGCGFDLDRLRRTQASSRPPLGLAGMQERAALLGGAVTVKSQPGEGTVIDAFVPYQDTAEVRHEDAPAAG